MNKPTKPKFDAKKELRKLKTIVKCLPEDKLKMTEGLVADAAFMAQQLEQLRDAIEANGWSEEYRNGENQYGRKPRVEADMYIKIQKSYAAVVKQLTDLLPESEITVPGQEIMEFLKDSKR